MFEQFEQCRVVLKDKFNVKVEEYKERMGGGSIENLETLQKYEQEALTDAQKVENNNV